jgi:hypothetical protein
MPIENRDLPAGTRLEATYKKTRYVCVVEVEEGGKLAFVLEGGKRFKSPSSAASAVMGGSAANGWRFWSVEGETAATPAAHAPNNRARGPKPTGTRTRGKKAEAAAPQLEEGNYLIDSDGRPIPEDQVAPASALAEEEK